MNGQIYSDGLYGTGGICGHLGAGEIRNCKNKNIVDTSQSILGGIVGINEGYIEGCRNEGVVSSTGCPDDQKNTQGTGGIAGRTTGNIHLCSNIGNVTASDGYYIGGIVGVIVKDDVVISECFNSAEKIESKYTSGGIVGICLNNTTIKDCYNKGNLKVSERNCGGIIATVGNEFVIENCYNIGIIDGNNIGEFIGLLNVRKYRNKK